MAQLLAQIRRRGLQLGRRQEGPRGHDGPDLRGAAGRSHAGEAGAVVEQRRYPSLGCEGEEGDGRAGRIGQQQADPLARRRERGELAAQREAAGEQAVVAEGCAADVLDDGLAAAVDMPGLQQGLEQGPAVVRGGEDQIGHQVIELEPDGLAARAAAQRRIHCELARRQQGQGDLGKPAQAHLALQPREGRVLGAVDAQRQDHAHRPCRRSCRGPHRSSSARRSR